MTSLIVPFVLQMMIFLVEGVLPEGYFANHLRGLSVDMAVFRDLLRLRLSALARHLDDLQMGAGESSSGETIGTRIHFGTHSLPDSSGHQDPLQCLCYVYHYYYFFAL